MIQTNSNKTMKDITNMKRLILTSAIIAALSSTAMAIDNNTVNIVYNGSKATVTVASNISSYVTVSSGTASHVVIKQAENFAGVDPTVSNDTGEIIYNLSGTSTDGSFYLEGSFKCTVELDGVTLTNPSGPALNIQNGKRVSFSAKKSTTNTLTDGANADYNGCIHCKGHSKLKGKGTLNVVGNSRHAIYSKEYVEIKNLTLNITGAVKDGIHCKQYFLMESGTVKISGTGDDGIQVELKDLVSTGVTTDHEDEDTGNFYMTGGTLTISGYTGKAIKADGTVTTSGGTRNYNAADVQINAGIDAATSVDEMTTVVCDISGRRTANTNAPGCYIIRQGNRTRKIIVK